MEKNAGSETKIVSSSPVTVNVRKKEVEIGGGEHSGDNSWGGEDQDRDTSEYRKIIDLDWADRKAVGNADIKSASNG
jgi:hypothetical protein